MFILTKSEQAALERLAERIQRWRVNKEPVTEFAARIGASAPTYGKLEKADPAVKLGILVRTLRLAGRLEELDRLFAESEAAALFADPLPARRRAPRRRKKPKA